MQNNVSIPRGCRAVLLAVSIAASICTTSSSVLASGWYQYSTSQTGQWYSATLTGGGHQAGAAVELTNASGGTTSFMSTFFTDPSVGGGTVSITGGSAHGDANACSSGYYEYLNALGQVISPQTGISFTLTQMWTAVAEAQGTPTSTPDLTVGVYAVNIFAGGDYTNTSSSNMSGSFWPSLLTADGAGGSTNQTGAGFSSLAYVSKTPATEHATVSATGSGMRARNVLETLRFASDAYSFTLSGSWSLSTSAAQYWYGNGWAVDTASYDGTAVSGSVTGNGVFLGYVEGNGSWSESPN